MQTPNAPVSRNFSGHYDQARARFLEAARARGATIESDMLPGVRGARGEELAIDTAVIGGSGARKVLVVSSGTHGPEGFAGSAAQLALLQDQELLQRAQRAEVALLLVHAVNPYGFSHLQRTNEDNVDLNRNHIDFGRPLPANPVYAELEPLLMPAQWPPGPTDRQALQQWIEAHGMPAFRKAVTAGQYTSPDGVFYGGTGPSWSNRTLRALLRRHAGAATHLGWVDIHTGLGPYGHGEKIYAGRPLEQDHAMARAWWGADLFAPFAGDSVSADVSGPVVTAACDECPGARLALMGLEFGTVEQDEVLGCLRAHAWLRRHPEAPQGLRDELNRRMRDAFCCDSDDWRGMVLGQTRVALLQAVQGLAAS